MLAWEKTDGPLVLYRWAISGGWTHSILDDNAFPLIVTHWMPLPEPPNAKG